MTDKPSAAYLDGWFAHQAKTDIEQNPHDARLQPYSNVQRTNGWCARFSAVKHGMMLVYDDTLHD